ncbi:NAD(P)/FAD-dependent oxidoreductase [Brevibacillus humidisoli]|uniref:NAD(P)/FAD-dependent oxidoreductase n=1 Tax=Brevibacillus humidisoli TaxID=2895522 RepID=UPI001E2862F4|nr:NAD(P)/FAD-dependent oxidoreductase [Brevibacillus humidisoli]UFJ42393.1 NAD(P)/FAD-dependent oxidoreductase [Brevibacillus humidisoli]
MVSPFYSISERVGDPMYDFIIVGARCAGAALACFLGHSGYKVLLIDKYESPGPTLSTHIIGEIDVYDLLGIREKMETAGAPQMKRMRVDLEGSVMESDMITTPRAISLRRELFDAILLEKVYDFSSVTVLLTTRATDLLVQHNQVCGVACQQTDGSSLTFYARAVIGADGRDSLVARAVRAEMMQTTDENHLDVVYAYLANVDPLPLPTVEWYWHGQDVTICNPIDQGLHCIALMMPSEVLSGWKDSLIQRYLERISRLQTLRPRLRRAEIAGRIRGVRKLVSYVRKPYGSGWALVGDAGAHLHPIAGVGIDNAVCSAQYLAEELDHYMTGKKTWQQAMEAYQHRRDERIVPQYEATLRTLARTRQHLSCESLQSLQMLCTFPSLVKALAIHSDEVLSHLQEVRDE